MTPEERDIIVNFIARVSGAQPPAAGIGSVPSTVPPLPSIDREADALIAEQLSHYPDARYRLTQLAFVQEHALAEAQNRLKRMEWELQQTQQQAQQAAQQAASQPQQSRGGFFGGLFGGGTSQSLPPQGPWGQGGPAGSPPPPNWQQQPPPPQYAPGYQQGMFQRPGSGFLGSALTTAAGVAGGVVVGNALMDMFSSHRGGGGMFGGSAAPLESPASPWASGGALPEPPVPPDQGFVDQGNWSALDPSAPSADNAWAQPQPDPSSWTDTGGGGWASDNSGGSDDDNFT